MLKIHTELIKKYFYTKYKEIVTLLILILSGTVVGAITPLLFGNIIDLILKKQLYFIIKNVMIFFCLSLLEIFLGVIEAYLGNKIVLQISNEIKKDLTENIINMKMAQIDQYAKGELVNRVEGDPEEIASTYISIFTGGIQISVSLVISIYFAVTFSEILTGIALIFMTLSYVGTLLYKKQYQKAKKQLKDYSDKYYSEITENFRNLEGIKSFNLQNTIMERLKQTYQRNFCLSKRMFFIEGKINFTKNIGNTIFETVLLLSASILIIHGKLSIGNLVSFNQYISNVFNSSSQVIDYIMRLNACEVNIKRIEEIKAGFQEDSSNDKKSIDKVKSVKIEGVDFKYNSDNILENVNLKIDSCGLYSIIGMNGAGKSTILKLLLKLYEPVRGNIYINNINYSELNLRNIRNEISYIPKNPILFNESIEYNLTLGKSVKREELEEICQKVGLDSFIKCRSGGYKEKIGDDGYSLSSGTKQKISIARAAIKDTSLWICDEITSDLDRKTELEIINLLREIAKNRIVIMVSHDFSSIRESKEIFVLHNKSIVCSGDNVTLRKNSEIYRKLFFDGKKEF